MKKKIINGILMAAFLFAGTTSFVSCKDNIDDEIGGVRTDIASLDGRLGALKVRVDTLSNTVAGHTTLITNLRKDVDRIDALSKKNKANIDSLALVCDTLAMRIADVEKYVRELTVGVTVQGTVDPVLGEVRGLLLNKNTLLGFIGKNDTEIYQFPIAGADYNVKGFEGTSLTLDEVDIEEALDLKGEKGEWLMDENTFGRVYISLDPMGADATKCSFYLVPGSSQWNIATGEFTKTSPVKFTEAYPSTNDLTLAFGKKAGMDWEDYLNRNEWDPESGLFPVKWAIDALVDAEDFEGLQFDWSTFKSDYVPAWKMADLMATIKEIWHNLQDGTKSRTERAAETIVSTQGVMKAIADALNNKRSELNQYAIGAVVNDTKKRGHITEFNISSVAIEPIGYMAAVNFDAVSDSYKWNLGTMKNLATKIYDKISARFPNFTSVNLLQNAGGTITATVTVPGGPGTATIQIDDVINALQLQQVQDMINDALGFYNRIKNGNAGNLVQRAENYLNRVTEQVLKYYDCDIATVSVMPLVMVETTDGFRKLVDGLPTNTEEGEFNFVLTSLTGEYIVPVFAKYVALEVDGEIVWHKAVPGAQKKFSFDLPAGKSTLLVQCVDYTGRVITQKYPFNAKAAE